MGLNCFSNTSGKLRGQASTLNLVLVWQRTLCADKRVDLICFSVKVGGACQTRIHNKAHSITQPSPHCASAFFPLC